MSDTDIFDNQLIFGDNLLALKSLEQDLAGQVKCIFIDPPYNTGSAFSHYDDGVEHSLWLQMMRDRLEVLRRLLATDGSIWMTIDDNEAHYLKVLGDEVFGRANFVANVVWEKVFASKNSSQYFSVNHDHLLVFARSADLWKRNLLPRSESSNLDYANPDQDPRGPWISVALSARNFYSLGLWSTRAPGGREIAGPPKGRYWTVSPDKFRELDADSRIWWGQGRNGIPRRKVFLSEVQEGLVPPTIWLHEEAGNTQEAKKEVLALVEGVDVFATPKPEKLLQRILQVATRKGELVLDSFGGSGTTAAVAHKMGRRWIMVELGEHCHTHIIPRMKKVIDGEDPGGITDAMGWKGGGGFRYYRLAPSLLEKDGWGNWVINKEYNAAMLAEAVCKIEGFTYAPSETEYWQHGRSTELDFLWVTTQTLSVDQLQKLSDEVGPERSLLVCCGAFRAKDLSQFPNLTVKKIPKAVLNRCEWGKDDYSLEIQNLPQAPEPEPDVAPEKEGPRAAKSTTRLPLFDEEGE